MFPKPDFNAQLVSKAQLPAPVTKALGTGTSASFTMLSVNLPYSFTEEQQGPTVVQAVPRKDR
jgi:hypothetical protein